MKQGHFKLFADCIPVAGFKRGIIYDLNRGLYKFVPNSLITFVVESEGKTKEEIYINYSEEFHNILDEYLDFLKKNDFNFWAPKEIIKNFGNLNLNWDYPAKITNAIIDIDNDSMYSILDSLKQLDQLGCKHIQIRSYCKTTLSYYSTFLTELLDSRYLSFEIITQYDENNTTDQIVDFMKLFKRVKILMFHSANENTVIKDNFNAMGNICFTKQEIKLSDRYFENNHIDYMNVSVSLFTESQSHHSYFNRKVAIDKNGNVKNCTSQNIHFGNIKKDSIDSVISKPEFQHLWHATKDKTIACKDCEFRYMCTDSRIPEQSSQETWIHNDECNYNPYIAKWKNEDGYIGIKKSNGNK